ncbi:hypothetical protein C2G38_2138711 [Gigaspora rosea]|uniref:Membrane anchor Opy2 N-terminal domain-containing protein n=1 Tax=Gigaspora rosea TaxID=44941 RepID=A0A397W2H9_9GLOM|nr:hypothetical protein C2G38_2138711 [Gigaspora rosea]
MDSPCLTCSTTPTTCDPPCDSTQVCILTEQTCSKCPERTCQPKDNPKSATCPTNVCPACNSTSECWVQQNFFYTCGQTYCVSSPKDCVNCIQSLPTCSDTCPANYKCYVWKQDCFTCSQARCVPESYNGTSSYGTNPNGTSSDGTSPSGTSSNGTKGSTNNDAATNSNGTNNGTKSNSGVRILEYKNIFYNIIMIHIIKEFSIWVMHSLSH